MLNAEGLNGFKIDLGGFSSDGGRGRRGDSTLEGELE